MKYDALGMIETKEMHEDPCVANYGRKGRGLKIEEGMVLAIEPMVNAGSYKIGMLNDCLSKSCCKIPRRLSKW